ncbi:SPOR domain-containing protein [Mangrovicoccus algicola]|uniref:SPOR domain-containing protein n=1 Tax=Mangrovicoccus algicola TaxID=2771008 RepID=A0A8J7CJK2_9RHOB|nr:SPOR domain-containing protein [Mangrovicoccus algicola]MBE3637711.1 SPOR domain-containing protein [Mangrovicoccus algicola]
MANPEFTEDFTHDVSSEAVVSSFMGWLGAGCSLALVVGVGWWGYDLAMRETNGIPVIAALEGPARVAPEDPGGFEAAHKGMSVTELSSAADVIQPEQITLAPAPVALQDTDQPVAEIAPVAKARTLRDAVNEALQDAGVLPSAAEAAPFPDDAGSAIAAPLPPTIMNSAPRPSRRPDLGVVSRAAYTPAAPEPEMRLDLDPQLLAVGTRLVQLGAYDSEATATAEWSRISGRFSGYFAGKQRVIERTERNGKVFYRLRAHGFDDLADARRFCASLQAGGADCIPVQVR